MEILKNLENIQKLENPQLTMGGFDGVHIGHQEIIKQLIALAKKNKGTSCLLTFEPHPRLVLQKDSDLKLLTSLEIKAEKLSHLGLDCLIVIPFTLEFSRMTSLEFVRDILVNKIGIQSFLVGYDHHFGKNREGNFQQLSVHAKEFGFDLHKIESVDLGEQSVSSTKIRNALFNGNLDYANQALGDCFELDGGVVKGDQIGKSLGFPTANLEVSEHQLIPKNGVYEVEVFYKEKSYQAMMNIGVRPSINSNSEEKRLEVHLFDFDGNLYNEILRVKFKRRIRDEKKFPSLDELKNQLEKDKIEIIQYNIK